METKTTDELVEIIVKEIGIPLPIYDYNDYQKYITSYPENISNGHGGQFGIVTADMHDTFRDACLAIIEWNKNIQ